MEMAKIILTPKVSQVRLVSKLLSNLWNASMGNVKEYDCPECGGKGYCQRLLVSLNIEVGKGTVISIEATMNQRHEKVIYRVADSTSSY